MWVEESRLECLEMLAEASIAASRHREVVSLLYGLIAEHPLREAYYQRLMVARPGPAGGPTPCMSISVPAT